MCLAVLQIDYAKSNKCMYWTKIGSIWEVYYAGDMHLLKQKDMEG